MSKIEESGKLVYQLFHCVSNWQLEVASDIISCHNVKDYVSTLRIFQMKVTEQNSLLT